jgi:hypothetical protein
MNKINQKNLLETVFFMPDSLKSPNAWIGHLPFAAWLISEIKPKIFVELGTHTGNSYFSFCQAIKNYEVSCSAYAVDTWEGDEHAGRYEQEIFESVNLYNNENFIRFSSLLKMPFDEAVTSFKDGSINLLHIDGLHTYEAVRHDFETWLPKLAPGAIVIFHDTNVRDRDFGVWKLWEELQSEYVNTIEFVHSHGLGVLQLNNCPLDLKCEWLMPEFSDKPSLIHYFEMLGTHQLLRFRVGELEEAIRIKDKSIDDLKLDLIHRDQEIQKHALDIQELKNSKSWRITAPLRKLGKL